MIKAQELFRSLILFVLFLFPISAIAELSVTHTLVSQNNGHAVYSVTLVNMGQNEIQNLVLSGHLRLQTPLPMLLPAQSISIINSPLLGIGQSQTFDLEFYSDSLLDWANLELRIHGRMSENNSLGILDFVSTSVN